MMTKKNDAGEGFVNRKGNVVPLQCQYKEGYKRPVKLS